MARWVLSYTQGADLSALAISYVVTLLFPVLGNTFLYQYYVRLHDFNKVNESCVNMRTWLCRKEEGYGTAPTFNVSILMGKRDEVTICCPNYGPLLYGLYITSLSLQ